MRKKKWVSTLLALLLFWLMAVPSLAMDNSRSFQYTLLSEGQNQIRVEPGQVFTVTVTLSRTDAAEDWAMHAWQTEVAYDAVGLELVEDSIRPASGIGSSFHAGAGENRVFFNSYSFSKSGKAYPASLEVGTFQLKARWGGEYTIHNVNYLVGTPGGMDRYECASGDLAVTVAGATVTERFTDVPADAWFADAVDFTVKKGLFQGVSETEFAPGLNMTRAMLVTVLHRLEGKPAPSAASGFEDVPADTWYTEAVSWSRATGVVKGYSDTQFGPNDYITREQMATILYRYARNKSYDVSRTVDFSHYEDSGMVSYWAAEAMSWANATGLIIGRSETTLNPRDTATRAEVATILMRFCRLEGIEKF